MGHIAPFITTDDWQELTGVSGIAKDFDIQNGGEYKFSVFLGGATPPASKDLGHTIDRIGLQGAPSEWSILNSNNTETVWVRSDKPTKVIINEG